MSFNTISPQPYRQHAFFPRESGPVSPERSMIPQPAHTPAQALFQLAALDAQLSQLDPGAPLSLRAARTRVMGKMEGAMASAIEAVAFQLSLPANTFINREFGPERDWQQVENQREAARLAWGAKTAEFYGRAHAVTEHFEALGMFLGTARTRMAAVCSGLGSEPYDESRKMGYIYGTLDTISELHGG